MSANLRHNVDAAIVAYFELRSEALWPPPLEDIYRLVRGTATIDQITARMKNFWDDVMDKEATELPQSLRNRVMQRETEMRQNEMRQQNDERNAENNGDKTSDLI